MARPKKTRRIASPPVVGSFVPVGEIPEKQEVVFLLFEEYEALRLHDYEKCDQTVAASRMQVSRPTFTRIYQSAREKIAKAFIEGLKIVFEGGKIEVGKGWFSCDNCKCDFYYTPDMPKTCPLCGSTSINEYSE